MTWKIPPKSTVAHNSFQNHSIFITKKIILQLPKSATISETIYQNKWSANFYQFVKIAQALYKKNLERDIILQDLEAISIYVMLLQMIIHLEIYYIKEEKVWMIYIIVQKLQSNIVQIIN